VFLSREALNAFRASPVWLRIDCAFAAASLRTCPRLRVFVSVS
jgi:hypothetical protein